METRDFCMEGLLEASIVVDDVRKDLKLIRTTHNYSQRKLARVMGLPYASIRKWENGLSEPRYLAHFVIHYWANELRKKNDGTS